MASKVSFCSRLCILWVGGKVEAKTMAKVKVAAFAWNLELLPTLGKKWWQHWHRRDGPILWGIGTIPDRPQKEPVRRGSKYKSSQKIQWNSNNPSQSPHSDSGSS